VTGLPLRPIAAGLAFVAYNLPNAAIPLAIFGAWACRKQADSAARWLLIYAAAIYFCFAIRYDIKTQFMFFQPFYAAAAVWAGVGFARLVQVPGRGRLLVRVAAISLAVGPAIYAAAPAVCGALHLHLPGSRTDLPFRDNARIYLAPWKVGEESARQFAQAALGELKDGDTLIADGTAVSSLIWQQRFAGAGRGVRILRAEQTGADVSFERPNRVFLTSQSPRYYPAWIAQAAEVEKAGPSSILFHVRWKSAASRPGGK
jgi:hypothetical protein